MTLLNWIKTVWMTATSPAKSFRVLKIDAPDRVNHLPDRIYLVTLAAMIGILWGLIWSGFGLDRVGLWSVCVGVSVVIMTYVEILGVGYFSRARGWRVSLSLSERVGCYSAVGWVPAALLFEAVCLLDQFGYIASIWPTNLGVWSMRTRLLMLTLVWGLSILGFEMLVWVGVRKVKYGNYAPRDQ